MSSFDDIFGGFFVRRPVMSKPANRPTCSSIDAEIANLIELKQKNFELEKRISDIEEAMTFLLQSREALANEILELKNK